MPSLARRIAGASLTAMTLVSPVCVSQTANAAGGGLHLTVSGGENTWIRGVALRCPPGPGSHHPRGQEACAALNAAGGNLDALPVGPTVCTQEYSPVTATASGDYRGHPVSWRKTFANTCVMQAETGPVFAF
ncbi:SSI family serine proteinase inhibitor [Streptomyces sp. NPDC048638]